MIVNKKSFVVTVDGNDIKLAAIRPSVKVGQEATLAYNGAFVKAAETSPLRCNLAEMMKKKNVWSDEKEGQYVAATKTLLDGELALKKGGIKLSEAKKIALSMRSARYTMDDLTEDRNRLDATTAEYFADNMKFNFLISQCTVYEDSGEPYYASYEDYISRNTDPVARQAADALSSVIHGTVDNFEAKLPENKFLLKNKLCDDSLHLVRKDGKWVDVLGRLVDDKNRLIDENGKLIDSNGVPLTEENEYDVETKAFLEDDGTPILEAPPLNVPESLKIPTTETPAIVETPVVETPVMVTTPAPVDAQP